MFQFTQASNEANCAAARLLFREYADQLGHDLCFQDFGRELDTLPGSYSPPLGCLLLASGGEDWAGCVAMRPTEQGICEMKRLYVRPRFRGQGLGRQLAAAAIEAARRGGHQRMRLDTLAAMHVARMLYESLGFRLTDPYYHNPIENVVFYELALTAPPGQR